MVDRRCPVLAFSTPTALRFWQATHETKIRIQEQTEQIRRKPHHRERTAMYPGTHAKPKADQAAFIMAQSGEVVTYVELEARTNRLAHFLKNRGLKRLDHYSIFMENNARYIECCGAGERSGLYFTCINSFLTADELAYIVNNSESKALIFSEAMRAVAVKAMRQCLNIEISLVVDGPGDGGRILNLDDATSSLPATPIADESV